MRNLYKVSYYIYFIILLFYYSIITLLFYLFIVLYVSVNMCNKVS